MNLDLGDTRLIIRQCELNGLPLDQTAYVLATAYWEAARTMKPVEEAYYLGSKAEGYRKKLRYYPWHGRGYVQLTWQANYLKAGQKLGVDLITDPDVAMRPDIAAQVLVRGMIEGWFTGKKLSDYINPGKFDYRNARRIVNGTDKAAEIDAIGMQYRNALIGAGYGKAPTAPTTTPRQSFWAFIAETVAAILRGKQ